MLRNPKYIYGPRSVTVPVDLNFGDFILNKMWQVKDKVAMINASTDENLTYAELIQQSMNFAVLLTRMEVKKGETIGIFSENRFEYFGAVIGAACAGAVVTTISTGYVAGELTHVLNISKPKYMICSPTMYKSHSKTIKSLKFVNKIIIFGDENFPGTLKYNDLTFSERGVVENVVYDEFRSVDVRGQTDTLFILYSSGTTGLPKGVMVTHMNVVATCSMPPIQNPKELTMAVSPWYHVMGLVGSLAAFSQGRTGIYLPKFNVDSYLRTIEKYKVTQLTVVPPVLVAVSKAQSNYDLSSVRMVYSGAAPLHRDTITSVHKIFPNLIAVFQGYGSTEVTLAVIRFMHNDPNTHKVGSVGRVTPDTIVKVVDIDTRQALGPNQPGELCAKGEQVMKGYIGKDRSEDFDDEGFYKTGDIGYYDEDGYFFIVDRIKELIKYKGYQVPPAELEAVLLQHEAIKDAAVVGVEDRAVGEVPLAFVVLQPGKQVTEDEVKQFVAKRLSNPKHLRGGVRFVNEIPKSAAGKLLRKELRKMVKKNKSKL